MITRGTVLVEPGTPVPAFFRLEIQKYPGSWMSLTGGVHAGELDSNLTSAGWTFHYMAGEVRATAFGFDRQKAMNSALNKLIAGAEHQKCNCLEIDEVGTRSFLGMPGVSITAHSRRIQKGLLFSGNTSGDKPKS